MVVLDSAGIHAFKGEQPPFSTNYALGDVEEHVFTDKFKSVFITVPGAIETGEICELAVRIMLDAEVLQVPKTGGVSKLRDHFEHLPKRAAIYAMRNGFLINYSLEDLRRDWVRLFKKNAIYRHLARTRYQSAHQALVEFEKSTDRNNRFFQKLQHGIYGRITAHTEELTARILFGAAVVLKFPKLYKCALPLVAF